MRALEHSQLFGGLLLAYSCDGRIRSKGAQNGREEYSPDFAKACDVCLTGSSQNGRIGF